MDKIEEASEDAAKDASSSMDLSSEEERLDATFGEQEIEPNRESNQT